MMNDRDEIGQDRPEAGLCDTCRHQTIVTTDRGSQFVFCEKSRTDPWFPRYPTLPVVACRGYEHTDRS